MKIKKYIKIMLAVVLLSTLVLVGGASAGLFNKVEVCHRQGNGSFILININGNAFDSHVAHGDGSPGGLVPGEENSYFNNACKIIRATYVESPYMDFGPMGWGGWSCPSATPNVVSGGYLPASADVLESMAWVPGASVGSYSYPITPFGYTYGTGETGWIVQNINTGQSLAIFLYCLP